MKNYIICTPAYSKSAGVRALFNLAHLLTKAGYTVSLFSHAPYKNGYTYITKITDEMRKNDIIVYPEIVEGNPLQFQNVVRYILFYPGKLITGKETFHSSEQLFTWLPDYYHDKSIPCLAFSFLDRSLFYDDNSPKTQNAYFVYKGGQFRDVPEIKGATRIDMKTPEKREDLGKLLRATDTLYSFDAHSALLNEACACGAKVKIITQDSIVDFIDEYAMEYETDKLAEQFETFVKITQEMNYTGEIEKTHHSFIKKLFYGFKILLAKLSKNSRVVYKYRLK